MRRQAEREEWFDTHADLIDKRELVTRAERAREIHIRVAAINNPDSAVRDLLGPEPTNQRARLAWRRAVETTAVYNARYPRRGGLGHTSARAQLIGDRPTDREAARDYDQTAAAIAPVLAGRSASRTREAGLGIEL